MKSNLVELKIVVDVNKINEESSNDFLTVTSKRLDGEKSNSSKTKTSIKSLNLSNRTVNALIKEGINFKEQAQKLSVNDFLKIKGLGERSLKELFKKLNLKYDKSQLKASKSPVSATKNGGMMENFEDYNLSNRTVNVLFGLGVTTPEDLRAMSDDSIRNIKGAGSKTLNEISGVIKRPLSKNLSGNKISKDDNENTVLNLEFSNLGFSTRTLNQLSNNNIESKKQLLKLDVDTIKSWKGAGKTVLEEIMKFQGKPMELETKNNSRGRPLKTVAELGLKSKTIKVLSINGITTLKALKAITQKDIDKMDGFDKSVINDIKDIIGYKPHQSNEKAELSCLNLPSKTAQKLISNGIKFVDDLKSKSDEDLKGIKGLGNSSVKKIHTALEKVG